MYILCSSPFYLAKGSYYAMINYDIEKPTLSPRFDLDDIHKIRKWNYERMKGASRSEVIAYYKNVSEIAEAERSSLRISSIS